MVPERIHPRAAGSQASRHRQRAIVCAAILLSVAVCRAQDSTQDSSEPPASIPPSTAVLTVHGTVHNAVTGEPLPRVLVRVEGDSATGALTDGDGKFEISGLAPGPQVLEVVKPGYIDRHDASAGTPADDSAGSSHSVIVAAPMSDLDFSLAPANAIRGQIALSTGDPAQGIGVQLLRRGVQDGRAVWQAAAGTRTLSDGSYRFAGLPDGQYAVYTNPAFDTESIGILIAPGRASNVAREGFASQFYPDSRDLAGAAKIRLANGEQVQANLNLTLEPFYAVTATMTSPDGRSGAGSSPPDRSAMNYSANVLDAQGHLLPYLALYDPSTRTVQAMLPDGTYSIAISGTARFVTRFSSGVFQAVAPSSLPALGSVEFTVAGHALSNLRVPLATQQASSVRLTVTHSSARPIPVSLDRPREVVVIASQAGGWISDGMSTNFAQGGQTGPMDVELIPPGSYWLHAHSSQSGICVASFTAGGIDLAREPLLLGPSGATAPLDLVARDDCARLTISLPAGLAALAPGEERSFVVYVVPDFDSVTDVEPVTLRPSTSTTATLEDLVPGSYHVYAFPSPVALEYRNRDALAALPEAGRPVTLSPGATSSLVLEVQQ